MSTETTTTDDVSTSDTTAEPAEDLTTDVTGQVADTTTEAEEEGKTFDLTYVRKLRKEAATYRERAGKVDELGARLHAALVQASGKLQDPTDLPYDPAHLEDPAALTAAIDGLLTSKPHLASRRPQGTIPQGATAEPGQGFSLSGALRSGAGR